MEHRTALGLFLALAAQRPVVALHGRASLIAGTARAMSRSSPTAVAAGTTTDATAKLVDVDANLLHPALADDIEHHIQVGYITSVCVYVTRIQAISWHVKSEVTRLVSVDLNTILYCTVLYCALSAKSLHGHACDMLARNLMLQVASSVGVAQFVVPGSTVEDSRGALDLAIRKPNVSKTVRTALL